MKNPRNIIFGCMMAPLRKGIGIPAECARIPIVVLWVELEAHRGDEAGLGGIVGGVDFVDGQVVGGVWLAVNIGEVGVDHTQVAEKFDGDVDALHIVFAANLEDMLPLVCAIVEEVLPKHGLSFLVVAACGVQVGVEATAVYRPAAIFSTMAHHLILGVEADYTSP